MVGGCEYCEYMMEFDDCCRAKFIPPGPWNPWNPNTAVPTAVPTVVPTLAPSADPSTEKKDEEDASKQPEPVTVAPTEQPVSPPW